MTRPTPKEIHAIAEVAGVPVDSEVATRIANSIGPAFDGFAAIARKGEQRVLRKHGLGLIFVDIHLGRSPNLICANPQKFAPVSIWYTVYHE